MFCESEKVMVLKKSVKYNTINAGTISNKKLPATILKALTSLKYFFTIFTFKAYPIEAITTNKENQ